MRLGEHECVLIVSSGVYRRCFQCSAAYVLFVVEPTSQNMIDKRPIEYTLQHLSDNQLDVMFLTLAQCDKWQVCLLYC
jgi:hypothetical protein